MEYLESPIRTKISAHLLDAHVGEGEMVSLQGWLRFCDEKKRWKPLEGKIKVYLDGKLVGEVEVKRGFFSFSLLSPGLGRHTIDLYFKALGYGAAYKSLEFEVVEAKERMKIIKIAKTASTFVIFWRFLILALLFALLILLLSRFGIP